MYLHKTMQTLMIMQFPPHASHRGPNTTITKGVRLATDHRGFPQIPLINSEQRAENGTSMKAGTTNAKASLLSISRPNDPQLQAMKLNKNKRKNGILFQDGSTTSIKILMLSFVICTARHIVPLGRRHGGKGSKHVSSAQYRPTPFGHERLVNHCQISMCGKQFSPDRNTFELLK